MQTSNDSLILGIDHGYGNIKTANKTFSTGADIFPQGFAAVADRLHEFSGTNMLCDIGNGTMNVMLINEN